MSAFKNAFKLTKQVQ